MAVDLDALQALAEALRDDGYTTDAELIRETVTELTALRATGPEGRVSLEEVEALRAVAETLAVSAVRNRAAD